MFEVWKFGLVPVPDNANVTHDALSDSNSVADGFDNLDRFTRLLGVDLTRTNMGISILESSAHVNHNFLLETTTAILEFPDKNPANMWVLGCQNGENLKKPSKSGVLPFTLDG